MSDCFYIKWVLGESRGYTDRFAVATFANEVSGAEGVHPVLGPRGGSHHARYDLTVKGTAAKLDYNKYKKFNERHGMKAGVMEFSFADTSRTQIRAAKWDGEDLEKYVEISARQCDDAASTGDGSQIREYGMAARLLRPEQRAFYEELERTYGGRCAVSGCPVPFALQAAHLTEVRNDGTDLPSNGLLIRADLHALLDTNQLAVHPDSRIVYLSEEACTWPEYLKLQGHQLSDPQPSFEANRPGKEVLVARWTRFVDEHGEPAALRRSPSRQT